MGDSVMTRKISMLLISALVTASGCRGGFNPAKAGSPEPPTLDVTSWTELSELYMEYPPLVAAQTVRFAVHLTRLADFSALNAGRPSIEMTSESGAAVTLPGSEPLRPGAFRVEGKLPPAGRYRWALIVTAPDLSDRHDLGAVTIFPDEASAVADAEKRPEKDPAAIAYLKEQQWSNPFATSLVRDGAVRESLRVPAAIEPLTGGEAIVAAPADGRYASSRLPSAIGSRQGKSSDASSLGWPTAVKIARHSPPRLPKRKPRSTAPGPI
jgi:membrane fusion protein, heavy metal efflux system